MKAVRLLLDTHAFLWWRSLPDRFDPSVRQAIQTADVVFVSAASAWEASIKIALGKLRLPESFEAGVADSDFERLPIFFSHAEGVARLPHHHRDPFDRLLIAQALAEGLSLVTHDRRFEPYGVEILWI